MATKKTPAAKAAVEMTAADVNINEDTIPPMQQITQDPKIGDRVKKFRQTPTVTVERY